MQTERRVAANPQTKPIDLGCESTKNWQQPVASIPGGEGGDCPPNKNIPGREYLFAPSKFLAELPKIAPKMHHKSPF